MDVSIITVTYRSAGSITACLESVLGQRGVEAEVIVVDNASPDDTVKVLQGFGARIKLIQNRDNIGFGRGCNQGFAQSNGRYICFFNPDAQFVGYHALADLCRAMDEHPAWGLAGSRVVTAGGELERPSISYPDQGRVGKDFSRLPGKIAWVVGASMIARREVFEKLGGFDPAFFLYGEETDLCLRARERGHEIGYVETVEIRHVGGASEAGNDPYDVWTRRTKGLHQFWTKHYPVEDVTRLVRRNRLRARYRLLVNGLAARFRGSQSTAWQKQRRYQAVWEVSSRFLQTGRGRP
jgi:GT2 family glycosyltransferase